MPGTRLRIVHVVRSPIGGIFRHIADLATEQARAGHAVGLLCDSTTGGAFEDSAIARLSPQLALGATRIPMRRQISPADLAAVRRVMGHLAGLEPDVVHGHGAKGGAYGRMIGTWLGRSRPVARLYAPHGGSLHYDERSVAGRVYFAVERLLERITDALVHVSAYEAETYRRKVGVPRCRAVVIENGLRPDEFEPVVPAAEARDFLYLGMMRDLKGPDVLIEALAHLHREGRAATAVLVGAGDDRPRYEAMVQERGLGEAVAFRDPMPARAAFALARTIVVPSRAESMPYVVLESIAAGLPIVATHVGGIPEVFGPRAGDLVPPGDARALAAAMRRPLDDPQDARAAAEARRDWLRPRFAIDVMAGRVEALYHEILTGKARRFG